MKRFIAILIAVAILLAVYFMTTAPPPLDGLESGNIAKWNEQ
jgi:hypothetical protein